MVAHNTDEVYALIGPLGCGKSTAAEYIKQEVPAKATVFEMSDFVRTMYEGETGGDVDDNSLGAWAADKKDENGQGYFARRLAETIDDEEDSRTQIISGIRSPEEADALDDVFGYVDTVAVWTIPELRFKRKYGEMPRASHPKWDEFMERNEREKWEWGCVEFYARGSLYEADYIIPNNDGQEHLNRRIREMIQYNHWSENPFHNDDIESVGELV